MAQLLENVEFGFENERSPGGVRGIGQQLLRMVTSSRSPIPGFTTVSGIGSSGVTLERPGRRPAVLLLESLSRRSTPSPEPPARGLQEI